MELSEINEKLESFARTEKALDDEDLKHRDKLKNFHADYVNFIQMIRKEGWIWTYQGYQKVK